MFPFSLPLSLSLSLSLPLSLSHSLSHTPSLSLSISLSISLSLSVTTSLFLAEKHSILEDGFGCILTPLLRWLKNNLRNESLFDRLSRKPLHHKY